MKNQKRLNADGAIPRLVLPTRKIAVCRNTWMPTSSKERLCAKSASSKATETPACHRRRFGKTTNSDFYPKSRQSDFDAQYSVNSSQSVSIRRAIRVVSLDLAAGLVHDLSGTDRHGLRELHSLGWFSSSPSLASITSSFATVLTLLQTAT